MEQLLGWEGFGRTTTAWPTIWLEALRVYCVQAFGVDCTDPAQLEELERYAYEAKREAYEAMYGEADADEEASEHAALDAADAADLVGEEEDPEDVQYRAQLDAEYSDSLMSRLAQGEDRQTLLEDVGVAAFQRLAAAAQRPLKS